ncbi:MAG: GTP-binding protein [Pseudomonadota bacterium]
MTLPDRIPVFLLSGFLGSGKSTLLNAFLNDPEVQDTAVIINEFGDVPVDHLLVRKGETTISQVSTGCLCCSDTTDIQKTLSDIQIAALDGEIGGFSRVIVEMSGLGDPAPLVSTLSAREDVPHQLPSRAFQAQFYLAGVITLFDTIAGASSIESHFEALKQIAFADRIVLTKTDLSNKHDASLDQDALLRELRELNASAEIFDRQTVEFSKLFLPKPYAVVDRGEDVAGWLALEAALALESRHDARPNEEITSLRHGAGIRTFSITRDEPLSETNFHRFLSILQESAGQRLLRVKGIIATENFPDKPIIIHAVQHSVSNPVRLDTWPDEDHRTRLVFITHGSDPEQVRKLFTTVIDAVPGSLTRSLKEIGDTLMAPFARTLSTLDFMSRRSQ